jgi:rubrerythrin
MPNFGDSLTGITPDHDLTNDELCRAVRFMISAEYEAIELYQKVRDTTRNDAAKKVIQAIIDEEVVHAGEFLKLLSIINPKETEFYADGEKEVSDLIEKGKKAFKLTKKLDRIAEEIESQDKVIALALDNISDMIENAVGKESYIIMDKNPKFIHKDLSFLKLPSGYAEKIKQTLKEDDKIRLRLGIGHIVICKNPDGYWVGKIKPGSSSEFESIEEK